MAASGLDTWEVSDGRRVWESNHSAILGEDREVQISLPERYNRTTIPYSVLLLLDV